MDLSQAISDIIDNIPSGYCFDSHLIIQLLIEKYSDVYLGFVASFAPSSDLTNTAHRQIGLVIKKLCEPTFFLQLDELKSWSFTIHHTLNICAIYQKV